MCLPPTIQPWGSNWFRLWLRMSRTFRGDLPIGDAEFSRIFLPLSSVYTNFSLAPIHLEPFGLTDASWSQVAGPKDIYLDLAWSGLASQTSHPKPWALVVKQGSIFPLWCAMTCLIPHPPSAVLQCHSSSHAQWASTSPGSACPPHGPQRVGKTDVETDQHKTAWRVLQAMNGHGALCSKKGKWRMLPAGLGTGSPVTLEPDRSSLNFWPPAL